MNSISLSTNPEVTNALNQCNLKIQPIDKARYLSGELLRVGDVMTEGTVIGFAYVDNVLVCVVYDETKEGAKAISTFECKAVKQ